MQGNYVRLVGQVKRAAEQEWIRKGMPVLNFSVAVPSDGNRPVYVDCIAYGSVVEDFEGYVDAGETVEVEGHLSFRTYTGANGSKGTRLFVHVDSMSEVQE